MEKVMQKRMNEDVTNPEENTNMEWLMSGVDVEARKIEIRSEVNEVLASIITRAVLKMESVSDEPIQIHLSSFGGDAYESLAVYDLLRNSSCDIHIVASGKIMSAAFIIFLAGDVRKALPHTTFMMHSASYGAEGTVKNHEVQVNEGKRLNNLFLDIAAQRTKRPKKWWYRKILNTDYYLNAEEAKEIGLLTSGPVVQKPKVTKKVVKKNVRKKV